MRRAFALATVLTLRASAELTASASCPPADGPGRVRCTAEARAAQIAWADVVIVSAPAFVVSLRGRVPPSDATDAQKDLWRFAFAIVGKQRGKGELVLRVRAVVCEDGGCRPEEREIKVPIVFGE